MSMSRRNLADVEASRLIARRTMTLCYKGNCDSTVLRKVRRPGLRARLGLKKKKKKKKKNKRYSAKENRLALLVSAYRGAQYGQTR